MKKIRVKMNIPPSEIPFIFGDLTLPRMPGEEIPIFDEKILESPEVKKALQEGKIEIINEDPLNL